MFRSTQTQTRNVMRTLLIIACASFTTAVAQTPAKEAKDTGTLAGRITADGHGVAGVLVTLLPAGFTPERKPAARATTGADGRYQLVNVPPGSYYLHTTAPVYIVAGIDPPPSRQERLLNVAAGDRLDGFDFTLTRGSVITGRVTNAEGKPVVETLVRVMAASEADRNNPQFTQTNQSPFASYTDDRGIYRLYGLAAGRYLVSIGETPEADGMRAFNNSSYYPRTFYGDTTASAEAKPVEVTGGAEASGVDIMVGKPARTYEAAGRVVDEAGHAVTGAGVLGNLLNAQGHFMGGGVIERTNERGEFHLKNLRPGHYSANALEEQAFTQGQSTSYSDAVRFEISEQDVSGLEIKLTRGATISGALVLEGTTSPAVRARLSELYLSANTLMSAETRVPTSTRAKLNADGSFLMTGLRPGTIQFYLSSPQAKGFTLARVERGGVVQPKGIEIAAGEQLTGVRVVVAYGAGVIRGQVQFADGPPPVGARLIVVARHTSEPRDSRPNADAEVDELGRFVIENLRAGEYELTLNSYLPVLAPGQRRHPPDRKLINVPDTGEVQVTLVFNQTAPQ